MDNSINNLNNVVKSRESMIDRIIQLNHNVKSDQQYDNLFKRYDKLSYKQLEAKSNKPI